jgi:hypothetical protein
MTTSATPLISSACTALSSSAIMFGSVRRLVIRLKAPEVTSLEGIEPIAKSPASRFELTLGAQCPTSSCPCETTVLLLASPGTPLQLATTDPIARSILARPRSWCPARVREATTANFRLGRNAISVRWLHSVGKAATAT